jgi:hypothetical protein
MQAETPHLPVAGRAPVPLHRQQDTAGIPGGYRREAIVLEKKLIIAFFELGKVDVKKLPKWGFMRFSLLVNLCHIIP